MKMSVRNKSTINKNIAKTSISNCETFKSSSNDEPGLIETETTGRLTTAECFPPIISLRKSQRKCMNGFNSLKDDHMKGGDIKMGNGAAPSQMSVNIYAENNLNPVVSTTHNSKKQHGWMEVLCKSNDCEILIDEFGNLSKDVVIDSSDDEVQVSAFRKIQANKIANVTKRELPIAEPVNSFKDKRLNPFSPYNPDWFLNLKKSFASNRRSQRKQISVEEENNVHKYTERQEKLTEQRPKNSIIDTEKIILNESVSEKDIEFPKLNDDQKMTIKSVEMGGPQDEVLVSKFNINITRRDIRTLLRNEWLNDNVINFYMNLLMESSKGRDSGLPRVYALNTFFVPRLLQSGHSAVRRWTRKVDIFSYDLILVPVHVNKDHWSMAIIHLRNKTLNYYDSLGTPNTRVLHALEEYLKEESLYRRMEPFDTSKFIIESVENAPRQNNGCDCGVFSCMFAKYVSRDREATFKAGHVPYFRQKIILEIIQGKLLS